MPQLPSGKHVAVEFEDDFANALMNWRVDERTVWMFMPIRSMEDLFPWLRIHYLYQKCADEIPVTDADMHVASVALPNGMYKSDSGYSLAQSELLMQCWSKADKEAFMSFIEVRAKPMFFLSALDRVKQWQAWAVDQAEHLSMRRCYDWWQHQHHPAQIGHWLPGGIQYNNNDIYTVVSALMSFSKMNDERPVAVHDFLCAFYAGVEAARPEFQYTFELNLRNVRRLADIHCLGLRDQDHLRRLAKFSILKLIDKYGEEQLQFMDEDAWNILKIECATHFEGCFQ